MGMGRRGRAALAIGVATTVLTACGPSGCTDVGGTNTLRIQIPEPLQKLTRTWRIELCQADRCEDLDFPSKTTDPTGMVADGISLAQGAYLIDLNLLGERPKADLETTLTVLGVTASGRPVLRHTEQFTFDGYYPNGRDCDKDPYVRHSTALDGDDLVA